MSECELVNQTMDEKDGVERRWIKSFVCVVVSVVLVLCFFDVCNSTYYMVPSMVTCVSYCIVS